MATVEADVPVTEQPPAPLVTEEAKPVEKPVREKRTKAAPREKKPKVSKEKKPKQKTAAHPPYFQMIKEAILALNEKSGSSPYAIAKYMEEKHKAVLPANFRKILALQIKNSAARGNLIKIKASYKLSEAGKKGKAAAAAATTTTKAKTEKKSKPAPKPKKTEATKKPAKKVGAAKKKSTSAKPKQPKSIKSPVAKKAKKGST